MALDKETEERIEQPVSEEAEREIRLTPDQAVRQMKINVPVRGNRKLRKLLARFYDPTEGRITIDGNDLRGVTQSSLRHQLGIVPQEGFLFAGTVRVADALDMEQGRSRIPFARGSISIHSLSAAAIEDVAIKDGEQRPVLIEITMNNSSGIYQVDSLLKAKLQGSGLEPYVEVVARIDTEAEKRLVPIYRLEI